MNTSSSFISTFLLYLNDPILLVQIAGYLGLNAIIFAETGLFFGFFLPGDSLLLAAGIFAGSGSMSIQFLLISLTISAIVGDATGFWIGRHMGHFLYEKKETFFFRKKHLHQAQDFYNKHGGKTIILARFIPIIRTFAPAVAGAAKMKYSKFASFNIIGAILWIFSLTLSGYFLGKVMGESISKYLHFLIVGIIFLSVLPLIVRWFKKGKISNV